MTEPVRASRLSLVEFIASLAIAIPGVGLSVSLAALVFSGDLAGGLPRAITSFVVGGAIVVAYVGWRSSFVPVLAVVQDGGAVVMVAVGAGVASRGGERAAVDVIVLIGLITLVSALGMWLVGRFALGNLVRYIPNTVVAAFIAGTGYLLVKGGMDVMVGFTIERDRLLDLVDGDVLRLWLPGVALGVVLWSVGRSRRLPPVAMSLAIVVSLLGFYVAVAVFSSFEAVEAGGWLIGPFSDGAELALITPAELADVAWSDVLGEIPGVVSVVAVTLIALLLNISGLEFVHGGRVNVDRELRETAIANAVAAPFGVLPGFHGLGDTTLATKLGGTTRAVPLITAAAIAAFGVFGSSIMGYIPRMVLGALLVTIGVTLLVEWVVDLRRTVGVVERALSVGIVGVIAVVGIIEGIAVGVVAISAVFVFRYSRIDPVRRIGSGREMISRVDRTPAEVEVLTAAADRLAVYQLQGYLFFGSLTSLESQVRARFSAAEVPPDAVVFDLRQVTGIDSSGYALITQLVQHVGDADATVVVSGLAEPIKTSIVAHDRAAMRSVHWFATLDEALEHVEEQQLGSSTSTCAGESGAATSMSAALAAEFSEVSFPAGSTVMGQDDTNATMIVVRRGTLTAVRVDDDGHRHRMRRFGPGSMIGEIGLVTRGGRTADVIADTDVDALLIDVDRYQELRRRAPEVAFELHEFILRVQADRVRSMTLSLAEALR